MCTRWTIRIRWKVSSISCSWGGGQSKPKMFSLHSTGLTSTKVFKSHHFMNYDQRQWPSFTSREGGKRELYNRPKTLALVNIAYMLQTYPPVGSARDLSRFCDRNTANLSNITWWHSRGHGFWFGHRPYLGDKCILPRIYRYVRHKLQLCNTNAHWNPLIFWAKLSVIRKEYECM